MERHFEKELDDLRGNLSAMGSLVDAQLETACEALFGGRTELAAEVFRKDVEVDEFDVRIDRQCQQILALSQPVAIDLRLLMAGLQINGQLERIGDIAVNIAERARLLAAFGPLLSMTRLEEMAQIARIMVRDSLESFMQADAERASRVLATDDVVDNLGHEVFSQLVAAMREDHGLIEPAAHMLILIHHIERMADHATNIAEDVIFLVEARMVKHSTNSLAEE